MENVSEEAITKVWIICLVLGLVVTIVVAILLIMIRNTARKILGGVQLIWTEGKLVAQPRLLQWLLQWPTLYKTHYNMRHHSFYVFFTSLIALSEDLCALGFSPGRTLP